MWKSTLVSEKYLYFCICIFMYSCWNVFLLTSTRVQCQKTFCRAEPHGWNVTIPPFVHRLNHVFKFSIQINHTVQANLKWRRHNCKVLSFETHVWSEKLVVTQRPPTSLGQLVSTVIGHLWNTCVSEHWCWQCEYLYDHSLGGITQGQKCHIDLDWYGIIFGSWE